MLRNLKPVLGFDVRAIDGEIGRVHDFLFDDDVWSIRYADVSTGSWLFGRRVLLSPLSFLQPAWENRTIQVDLTMEKVRNSPDIDTTIPVARHQRMLLDGYYGWSATLAAGGTLGVPFMPASLPEAEMEKLASLLERADPHLRSAKEVIGYHIKASDGEIGHVVDFITDDGLRSIAYLVVDTRNWLPARKVLISPGWTTEIHWNTRSVVVDLSQDSVRQSPKYDLGMPIDAEYESRLHDHYADPEPLMRRDPTDI